MGHEQIGAELLKLVLSLGAIFGTLALALYGIEKLKQYVIARRRQRRINEMFKHLPLRQDRPAESPRSPRVLYVPKYEEPEPEIIRTPVFIGWDLAKAETERTEVFVGKGGQSGGAGANGEWEENTVKEGGIAVTTHTLPAYENNTEVDTPTFETSETTIEAPSES